MNWADFNSGPRVRERWREDKWVDIQKHLLVFLAFSSEGHFREDHVTYVLYLDHTDYPESRNHPNGCKSLFFYKIIAD